VSGTRPCGAHAPIEVGIDEELFARQRKITAMPIHAAPAQALHQILAAPRVYPA
jgi:hypothetical protein